MRALALALSAAVAFLAVEYYRQFARWQPIFQRAFDHPGSRLDGLAFSSQQLDRDDTLPALTGGGLRLAPGRMVWVETSREAGDVRVEARLRWRKRVDGAEMMINTRREQPAQNGWCPTGYSCQFGGSSGRLTFISRNDVPQPPRQGGAA